jgi:DNA topoisomerase-1
MVEPPGLFRGRADHELHGRIKLRIRPEDVTINCSACYKVKAPTKGRWKEIVHDQNAFWLAKYTNNLVIVIHILSLG